MRLSRSNLKRRRKSFGPRRTGGVNWFWRVVALAALTLVCFLLYALVRPLLFGEERETQVMPYGWADATQTAEAPVPVTLAAPLLLPTPLPTATPTAAPTLAPPGALSDGQGGAEVCTLIVRLAGAAVRTGPGEDYSVVGTLATGQTVSADGWATGADGYTWWRLGASGWARGDAFLDALNPNLPDGCLTLAAVGTLPPTPGPAGSAFTATPPLSIGGATCTLTVRWTEANIRAGPGTSFAITGKLALGQTVSADGWATGAEGFTWWRLVGGGWARGDIFLDPANPQVPAECVALPSAG
ncbi:MAG: SH3 domain-containing protein [Chloroflexota bacterium]